ncbi:MAG: hypothetical protein RML36_06785 [Anaerolineae bacterium]|nr:hypothetical protein [Anaerolineae bacterium]
MTYEEFLTWADEDTVVEWTDGEVLMIRSVSKLHQELSGFLYRVISTYVEA